METRVKDAASPSLQALGPYSVSKTALLGLTRALAPELAQDNIRVNCVAPGVIKTRFSSAVRSRKNTQIPHLQAGWGGYLLKVNISVTHCVLAVMGKRRHRGRV